MSGIPSEHVLPVMYSAQPPVQNNTLDYTLPITSNAGVEWMATQKPVKEGRNSKLYEAMPGALSPRDSWNDFAKPDQEPA